MKEHLGPKHFITMDASSLQIWLMVARSKTSKTTEIVYEVLEEMTEQLGATHPSTLQLLGSLLSLYASQG